MNAFERAGAVTPGAARALYDLSVDEHGPVIKRLRGRAVVREAAPGLFYADLEVWRGMRQARRRMILLLLACALALYAAKRLGYWH